MITVTVKDKKISMSGHACRKDSTPGSICYTPALDMCIMGNNGQWGAWN